MIDPAVYWHLEILIQAVVYEYVAIVICSYEASSWVSCWFQIRALGRDSSELVCMDILRWNAVALVR
jgi:hypothetical protein